MDSLCEETKRCYWLIRTGLRDVPLVLERGAQKAGVSQGTWKNVGFCVKYIWEKQHLEELRYCKYLHGGIHMEIIEVGVLKSLEERG